MLDRQPTDEVFDDIKQAAISVWLENDSHPGYTKSKVERVQSITNVKDNWNSIIGMFDTRNQMILWHYYRKQDTVDFLRKMWQSGLYNPFIPRDKI